MVVLSKVSVIIPAYNAENCIEDVVDALKYSLDSNDEIIIVDDCSIDRTLEKVQDKSLNIKKLPFNQGPSVARNHGALFARNPILVFIDSDVMVNPSTIDNIKGYFRRDLKVGAVTGKLSIDSPMKGFFSQYKHAYMHHTFSRIGREVNFLYGSVCAVRASLFEPWPNEDYSKNRPGVEDSALGLKLRQKGVRILCPDNVQVKHLKSYSFMSLIFNDFRVAYDFANLFLKQSQWKTLFSSVAFGHISKVWMYSVVLSGFTVIFLLNEKTRDLGYLATFTWFIINFRFHNFIKRNFSLSFLIRAIAWNFFDQIIILMGIIIGAIRYCLCFPIFVYKRVMGFL